MADPISLQQSVKYGEEYVSRALNLKFAGVIEPGIYKGFLLRPGGKMQVIVENDPDYHHSVAVVDRDGYSITLMLTDPYTVEIPAKGSWYIVIEAFYSTTQKGYQRIVARERLEEHHVVIGRVNVEESDSEITEAMLFNDERTQASDIRNQYLQLVEARHFRDMIPLMDRLTKLELRAIDIVETRATVNAAKAIAQSAAANAAQSLTEAGEAVKTANAAAESASKAADISQQAIEKAAAARSDAKTARNDALKAAASAGRAEANSEKALDAASAANDIAASALTTSGEALNASSRAENNSDKALKASIQAEKNAAKALGAAAKAEEISNQAETTANSTKETAESFQASINELDARESADLLNSQNNLADVILQEQKLANWLGVFDQQINDSADAAAQRLDANILNAQDKFAAMLLQVQKMANWLGAFEQYINAFVYALRKTETTNHLNSQNNIAAILLDMQRLASWTGALDQNIGAGVENIYQKSRDIYIAHDLNAKYLLSELALQSRKTDNWIMSLTSNGAINVSSNITLTVEGDEISPGVTVAPVAVVENGAPIPESAKLAFVVETFEVSH